MAEPQIPYLLERLRRAMSEDDRVTEPNVRVTVAGGALFLNGVVGSPERRAAAEKVVREIAPNFEVYNDITVLSLSGPTEESLE